MEYASKLRRLGLVSESLRKLDKLDDSGPVLLERAYCHLARWDHSAAAEALLNALTLPMSEKENRSARLKLASSLIGLGAFDSASKWLSDLPEDPKCLELQAQILIARGDYAAANSILKKIPATDVRGRLLMLKWRFVLVLHESPTVQNVRKTEEFRTEARRLGQWEVLRGFDWEVAKTLNDPHLAAKVYFGSPFRALQREILSSPLGALLPSHIIRSDSRWRGQNPKLINPLTGENLPFKSGSSAYRTVMVLLSDYYAPWTVCRLFEALHSDEDFHPEASAKKMQVLLEKVNAKIHNEKIPLELKASPRGFRLRPVNEGMVIVHNDLKAA